MTFSNRAFARVGVSALGLVAAGAFAAPAFAGTDTTADLAIEAAGGSIAPDASGKFSTVSLVNNSDVDATNIRVTLDVNRLDQTKVKFTDESCGKPQNGKYYCGIKNDILKAHADVDWLFPLQRVDGAAPGSAGTITVTIEHEGTDPVDGNNTVTLKVEIAEAGGPDLLVLADDVDQAVKVDDHGNVDFGTTSELNPGDTTALGYYVVNQGDQGAAGLTVTVNLPDGATFTEKEAECKYGDDNRSAVCTYPSLPLIPVDKDEKDGDDANSAIFFYNLITIGNDVDAPAKLTGGTVSAEPIAAQTRTSLAPVKVELPENATFVPAGEVDASDNSDAYTVTVAAAENGGGNGGGDGGPTLPITGAQIGLISAMGGAVVVIGGAMFLLARRRKVVLVTPEDEKPSA